MTQSDRPSEGTKINGKPLERDRRIVPRENWYRDVWLIAITVLVVLALRSFESNQDDLTKVVESNEVLTNQMCVVLVNVHDASLVRLQNQQRQLTQTLNYIRNIPPDERGIQLNRAIVRNVPQLRSDLRAAKQSEMATRVPSECFKRQKDNQKKE